MPKTKHNIFQKPRAFSRHSTPLFSVSTTAYSQDSSRLAIVENEVKDKEHAQEKKDLRKGLAKDGTNEMMRLLGEFW